MDRLLELGKKNRQVFFESQRGKQLEVLIEKCSSPHPNPLLPGEGVCWSGWTQNYLEADETNFEIVS